MNLEHLLVRAATIIHPGTSTDRYGNTVADWDDPDETDVSAWIAQRSADEIGGQRDAFVSGFVLFVDATVAIDAGDRVDIDGTLYEVDGPPTQAWRAVPDGLHHIEAPLRRIEG